MTIDISLGRWLAERARRSPRRRALTYKLPSRPEIVDSLPRTPSGPVVTCELRARNS